MLYFLSRREVYFILQRMSKVGKLKCHKLVIISDIQILNKQNTEMNSFELLIVKRSCNRYDAMHFKYNTNSDIFIHEKEYLSYTFIHIFCASAQQHLNHPFPKILMFYNYQYYCNLAWQKISNIKQVSLQKLKDV